MNYTAQKCGNWISSKTMVHRPDLTGDQKWILSVLIAACFAISKAGPRSGILPTLSGVSKSIGRTVEQAMPDFEDLRERGFIEYNNRGVITDLFIDVLEEEGVVDPGTIPNV